MLKMAKGQRRSNREIRKPKASKLAVATETPVLVSKKIDTPVSSPKKKG
jgi:hypothetical protein